MRDADGYKDDDMAAVGRALMAAIERETADRDGPLFGWHPADCPAEVVGDLVERVLQARTITDDMVEIACAAYATEYCGGEVEWPDGWNPVRSDDHRAAIRAAISAAGYVIVPRDLLKAVETVVSTFEEDEKAGYRSKDRQFAISILRAALAAKEHA